MRICVALLLFFLVSVPSAFAAQATSQVGQTPPSEPPLKRIYPTCDSYLSRANAAAQFDGRTALRFQLGADGKLGDGVVAGGSGNDVLDAAALACAQDSGLGFDNQSGVMTGAVVPAFVQWTRGGHSSLITGCPFQFTSIRLNEGGVVELAIHVSKDGAVSRAVVTKSSGFGRVDNSALACASTFRYVPVTRDGVPIEADRPLVLNLRLR